MPDLTCPNCGNTAVSTMQIQVRNGTLETYGCDECGHTWGHRLYPSGNSR